MVGVDIGIDAISEFLSRLNIGESGLALILNKNGDVIAHPDQTLIRTENEDGSFRFVNISEIDDVDMTSSFKEGESCAWWLGFNLIGPFGDMSVVKAAKDAGIRKVEVVDQRIESYIIVSRVCAHVYGK